MTNDIGSQIVDLSTKPYKNPFSGRLVEEQCRIIYNYLVQLIYNSFVDQVVEEQCSTVMEDSCQTVDEQVPIDEDHNDDVDYDLKLRRF